MRGAATVRFAVRLTPRASGDRVEGVVEGRLRVRVSAPPVEGAANEALIRLLAAELDVARSQIRLVGGADSRTKLLEVEGPAGRRVLARWPGLAV